MPNFHFSCISTYFQKYVLRLLYTTVICLPFLLSSCENCTFISDNVQFAAVSFYATDGSEVAIDTVFSKIVGVFTRTNEVMPTSLYDSTKKLKIFELPIFTRVDTTMFIFYKNRNLLSTVRDTLIMKYKVNVEVLPPDCGYDEAINNLEILFHTFTNVEILQTELKELQTGKPHIRIIR